MSSGRETKIEQQIGLCITNRYAYRLPSIRSGTPLVAIDEMGEKLVNK